MDALIAIKGELPVAITVLDGQKPLRLKQVVMQQITIGQSLKAQSGLKASQFILIGELSSMITLVDDDGKEHTVSYEALESSSRQNLDYLNSLRVEMDVKEQAES